MAVADPLVMPLAREMLACLDQEIVKVLNPPAKVELRAGSLVPFLISTTDNECCQGLAWVRPMAFYPSSNVFPGQDEVPFKGGTRAWAVQLELGAVRCFPTPNANQIVTAEQWDTATQAQMDDGAAMRRAICCFIEAKTGRSGRVLAGQWQPLDIEGGCMGGTIPVTILGPACDCADAGPSSS